MIREHFSDSRASTPKFARTCKWICARSVSRMTRRAVLRENWSDLRPTRWHESDEDARDSCEEHAATLFDALAVAPRVQQNREITAAHFAIAIKVTETAAESPAREE